MDEEQIRERVYNAIHAKYKFLLRSEFYENFFNEIVTATLQEIRKDLENNLTTFEKAIYDK